MSSYILGESNFIHIFGIDLQSGEVGKSITLKHVDCPAGSIIFLAFAKGYSMNIEFNGNMMFISFYL